MLSARFWQRAVSVCHRHLGSALWRVQNQTISARSAAPVTVSHLNVDSFGELSSYLMMRIDLSRLLGPGRTRNQE
jgi:hypothetical protein